MLKQRIGLIGAGNMGAAILEGALSKRIVTHSKVIIYDKVKTKARALAQKCQVKMARDLGELCEYSDLILLAIKPQDFGAFAAENKERIRKNACIVSILAGLNILKIRRALGGAAVVRVMPNLCAKVGESMTVLCGKSGKWLRLAAELFRGCGETAVLSERAFDHVTAMSGSGPAYFFYLMELLEDYGVKQGIPRSISAKLAVQTGFGAALLGRTTKIPCAELRKMVTSRKGTTDAALKILARRRFGEIFHCALRAAARRSRQLRQETHG